MALTRKALKAMEIDAEKVDEIINMHMETVDALKDEIDGFNEKTKELDKVKKELTEANEKLAEESKNDFKEKYDELKTEYDDFKNAVENKNNETAKETAYRELLKSAGVSEKRFDSILKVTNLKDIELEDGKFKDAEKIADGIKEEWADFIEATDEQGAKLKKPPKNEPEDDFLAGFDEE